MNYSKPEVSLLGNARTTIEYMGSIKGPPHLLDGVTGQFTATTAYDLDE